MDIHNVVSMAMNIISNGYHSFQCYYNYPVKSTDQRAADQIDTTARYYFSIIILVYVLSHSAKAIDIHPLNIHINQIHLLAQDLAMAAPLPSVSSSELQAEYCESDNWPDHRQSPPSHPQHVEIVS